MSKITCPQCNSDQISAQQKGFSGMKAVGGAILAGPLGAFAGTHGSGNIKIHCMACGFSWKPEEYQFLMAFEKTYKEKKIKEREEEKKRFVKENVIKLYEKGDKELATDIYLTAYSFNEEIPDIDAGYKQLTFNPYLNEYGIDTSYGESFDTNVLKLYDEGKFDLAEKLYLSKFSFDESTPDIKTAYRKIKQKQNKITLLILVSVITAALLFFWLTT